MFPREGTEFRGRDRAFRAPYLRVEDPHSTRGSLDQKSSSLCYFLLPDFRTENQPEENVFWRVSNAALANAALVLSLKNWKRYSRWGAASKNKSKKPWVCIFTLFFAGIDAALVKADFFFAGVPTIENKIEQKIQNTKVASAKVAFDTVRVLRKISLRTSGQELCNQALLGVT